MKQSRKNKIEGVNFKFKKEVYMFRYIFGIVGVATLLGTGYGSIPCAIYVKVYDGCTREEIKDAEAMIVSSDGRRKLPLYYDGFCYYGEPSGGPWDLIVKKEGYYEFKQENVIYCDVHKHMECYLTPKESSGQGIVITGKVIDKNGNPVHNAKVNIIPKAKIECKQECDECTTRCTTLCPKLPLEPIKVFTNRNGEYVVALTSRCPIKDSGCVIVHASKGDASEWYKDGDTTYIFLKDGMMVTGIDFTLDLEEVVDTPGICYIVYNESIGKLDDIVIVELYDRKGNKVKGHRKEPDDEGKVKGCFKLDSLIKGDTFYLKASCKGFIPEFFNDAKSFEEAQPIVPPVTGYLVIGLERSSLNKGVVLGKITSKTTQSPIEGARVVLKKSSSSLDFTVTDRAGNYIFYNVMVGSRYLVQAEAINYYPDSVYFTAEKETTVVDLKLEPKGSQTDTLGFIAGSVMDVDSNCLVGASVLVYPLDSDVPIVVTNVIDSGGCIFFTREIPVDSYYVFATYPGYEGEWYNDKKERDEADKVFVPKDGIWNINFVLEKLGTGRITGRIKDTANNFIEGALVWAKSKSGVARRTISGKLGEYVLEVPGNMLYEVGAEARGFEPNTYSSLIEVSVGETEDGIDIILKPLEETPYEISGKVTDDSTGEGIFPAIVLAISQDGFCGYSITDSSGNYVIENVPEAEDAYYVFAWAPLYLLEIYDNAMSFEDATLVDAGQTGVDFALKKVPGLGIRIVSGRIKDANNRPIEGAVIYVLDGNEVVGSGRSNKKGEYMIRNLPDRVYTLKIERVGYTSVVKPGVNLVGTSEEINIVMEIAGIEEENNVKTIKSVELRVIPNITRRGIVDVSFALPREMNVKLSLYDVTGREIALFVNEKMKIGIHSFNINTASLRQGVYFLKLITPTEKRSEKLLILH